MEGVYEEYIADHTGCMYYTTFLLVGSDLAHCVKAALYMLNVFVLLTETSNGVLLMFDTAG